MRQLYIFGDKDPEYRPDWPYGTKSVFLEGSSAAKYVNQSECSAKDAGTRRARITEYRHV